MTCDWMPIERQNCASVAMVPCPGCWAGSMWQLQLEKPASVRVEDDLEAFLCSRGIGAANLDVARATAAFRGTAEWDGCYQDEVLDWLDERHGPGLTWAETEVKTSMGIVPALLAVADARIVACVAPVVPPAKAKRFMGARLEMLEVPGGGGHG